MIIGESFLDRFYSFSFFINIIREKVKTAKILKLSSSCNIESLFLLNVANINSKSLKLSNTIFSIALDNTLLTNKLIAQSKFTAKNLFLLSSHGSTLASKFDVIIPAASHFEKDSIFLNLEKRPQKTRQLFSSRFDLKETKKLLTYIFDKDFLLTRQIQNSFDFLFEIIENKNLFDALTTLFSTSFYILSIKNKISLHPIKASYEDHYSFGSYTKNSLLMLNCSDAIRKTNFLYY
jgi:NADH dehydrogenase/NADH:ubiquinone oxidoreductase subunit G